MKEKLAAKIEKLKLRLGEIEQSLSDPTTIQNRKLFQVLTKEHSDLAGICGKYDELVAVEYELGNNEQLMQESADDEEFKELIRADQDSLTDKQAQLEKEIKLLLIPPDKNDHKNTIMEIRAGTGGEESALFAADLYRMYARYAEAQGWRTEILSSNPTGLGGLKEIIISVQGKYVHRRLKYESGTHRVQRVPVTETSGRIHTSAATVAVLPEAEELDIAVDPAEIRVDVFRSSGPGGQSVNTTDSAVRITHVPTGIVVQCQDEKSQLKNKNKAMRVLKARLLSKKEEEERQKMAKHRKQQIGTGDRSEKIRTYNFPQNRVTDHRIGVTLYNLTEIIDGTLEPLIQKLLEADYADKLEEVLE